jgi:hypothetical protein
MRLSPASTTKTYQIHLGKSTFSASFNINRASHVLRFMFAGRVDKYYCSFAVVIMNRYGVPGRLYGLG